MLKFTVSKTQWLQFILDNFDTERLNMSILPIVSKLSNKTQDVLLLILFKGIAGNFN